MSEERGRELESSPDPRSGVGEDGSWSPAFEGQRRPFEAGNAASVRHGAFASPVKLAERAREVAELLAEVAPARSRADDALLSLAAMTLVRIERAAAALEDADQDGRDAPGLEDRLRSWIRTAARLLEAAGMSPAARAQLGLTLTELEQARRRSLRLDLLSEGERDELERLIRKAAP